MCMRTLDTNANFMISWTNGGIKVNNHEAWPLPQMMKVTTT